MELVLEDSKMASVRGRGDSTKMGVLARPWVELRRASWRYTSLCRNSKGDYFLVS